MINLGSVKILKDDVIQRLKNISKNPLIGKPMRYTRKRTREVYVSPYRLS